MTASHNRKRGGQNDEFHIGKIICHFVRCIRSLYIEYGNALDFIESIFIFYRKEVML